MAKTAAQLVPLKNQLSGSMSIFRFADSTTDFAGSVAYQGFLYDNSGCSVTPNGTTGVQSTAGTMVPATPLAIPGAPVLTSNQNGAYTISSGLNRYQTQQYYHVVFYDSSYRESQAMVYLANIPGPTTTGSVAFQFNWPANAAGAVIYKPYSGQGYYAAVVPNTVGSYVDGGAYAGGMSGASGVSIYGPTTYMNAAPYNVNRYPSPSPSAQSIAPTISTTSCVITANSTGGSFRASGYTYGLSAFNTLGETTLSAETAIANITGVPWISGASSGVMNNVTLAQSTASGALPIGKYYYQVTAYTQTPFGVGGANQNGFTNSNGYGSPSSGAGWTESLPCAEVNVTTTGVGNVTLSWTAVTNAAGYVIYRSRDLPPPVVSAPTTATTGGTLPATTAYYYVVTATNALGETLASNEVTITTGGTSTNTVTLSWANVPNAYGYKVYRGTSAAGENALLTTITSGATVTYTDTGTAGSAATPPVTNTATGAGQETYIGQVASGTTSFIDSGYGSYPAAQNSGFQPPKTYNGIYSSATVQASWTSVSGATGYNLYRNQPGLVANQVNMSYFNVTSGVTVTDSGSNISGTKYSPQINWSGSNNITLVGRYMQVPANAPYIDKMGFTASLVPGQTYRFNIYSQTSQTNIYNSGYFTATTSALQYYEIVPNANLASYAGHYVFFYIQGQNTTSTIAWGPNAKPGLVDNATIGIQSENNTWAGYYNGSNYGVVNSSNQLGTAARDGNVPTQVYSETACNFPMRINFRLPFSGTNINGVRGTMLGGPRVPQYAYSNNTTYTTPIKSLVPNWNVLAPNTSGNPVLFANRWVTVEVSTDGGSTYTALTNQSRYVFPSPVTQLQYRYTVPQNSMAMSFDRRLMTGLPATDNTSINSNSYNYYYTPDTSQVTGYYYQVQNRGDDLYMYSNGNMLFGNVYNNWQYNFWSVQSFSVDVDMSMTCYFNQGGNIGLRFRNDGSNNSYGGYYAYIDNAGNWGLNRATYSNGSTTLASGSGATNGILNQSHILRVIAIGSHIQFFVDGLRVLDYTATDTGNYLTGQNVGISGGKGIAQSFQATALTTASLANSPAWELEYVSAYLET